MFERYERTVETYAFHCHHESMPRLSATLTANKESSRRSRSLLPESRSPMIISCSKQYKTLPQALHASKTSSSPFSSTANSSSAMTISSLAAFLPLARGLAGAFLTGFLTGPSPSFSPAASPSSLAALVLTRLTVGFLGVVGLSASASLPASPSPSSSLAARLAALAFVPLAAAAASLLMGQSWSLPCAREQS